MSVRLELTEAQREMVVSFLATMVENMRFYRGTSLVDLETKELVALIALLPRPRKPLRSCRYCASIAASARTCRDQ
jgi:hypothetical protein